LDTIHHLPHINSTIAKLVARELGISSSAFLRLDLSTNLRGINPIKVGTLVNQHISKLLQTNQLKSGQKWRIDPNFEIGMCMGFGVCFL